VKDATPLLEIHETPYTVGVRIVRDAITRGEIQAMAAASFGNMVKAVVDVEQEIMAVDAELHADEEAALLEQGSLQKNLWGINLYPDATGDGFVEFDSMINLRPSQGNLSRGVDDPETREKILRVVAKLVKG